MDNILEKLKSVTGVQYSDEQREVLEHKGGMCIVACAGSGKALTNDTRVMTPKGYRAIGTIKQGDYVISDEGKPVKVLGVYPQNGRKRVYEVVFSDGSVIKTCGEHLWEIKSNDTYVQDTKSILEDYFSVNAPKKGKKVTVKTAKPVQFDSDTSNLPINGYALGALTAISNVWLSFKTENNAVVERVQADLEALGKASIYKDGDNYIISGVVGELSKGLLQMGVLKDAIDERYAPLEVWLAPIKYRADYMSGVIESSGYIENGHIYIKVRSEELVKDIALIAESLGFICKASWAENEYIWKDTEYADGSKLYTVEVWASKTSIPRKFNIQSKDGSGLVVKERSIIGIKPTYREEHMTCIEVDSRNHLYLTEHCIPTHNTTTLCHLLVKRILSGEIHDTNKLMVTTYSRAGREELQYRVNDLLEKMGVYNKVEIRTLHSMYYKILKSLNRLGNLGTEGQRLQALRLAMKDVGIRLDEDDEMTLSNLLSYQLNNMMTDEMIYNDCSFTLEITMEQYVKIRKTFGAKKAEMGIIDFDDLQLQIYVLLKQDPRLREYVRNLWDYFYIDEFQDVSKLQYAILRYMLKDPSKLVVIGDDDQCLIEGTIIETANGPQKIEDICYLDRLVTCVGCGNTKAFDIDNISKKEYTGEVIRITTETGREVVGTPNHVGFARIVPDEGAYDDNSGEKLNFTLFGSDKTDRYGVHKSIVSSTTSDKEYYRILREHMLTGEERKEDMSAHIITSDSQYQEKVMHDVLDCAKVEGLSVTADKYAKLNDNKYMFMPFGNMIVGMYIPTYDKDTHTVTEEKIVKIEKENYNGYVYDISVPSTRNYSANGIFVHNCIYEWRGADPNIILNICGTYDIDRFLLSTNYRCGGEIVKKANVGIQNNNKRFEKQMQPYNQGGKINLVYSYGEDYYKMSTKAFSKIRELILDGVREDEISVLCRNNIHGAILNNMLLEEGIVHRAAPELIFHNIPKVKDLKACVEIGSDTNNFRTVAAHLWKIVEFLGNKNANILGHIMKDYCCSLCQAIKTFLVTYCGEPLNEFKDNVKFIEINLKGVYPSRITSQCIYSLKALYKDIVHSEGSDGPIKIIDRYVKNTEGFLYKSKDSIKQIEGCAEYMRYLLSFGLEHYEEVMAKTKNLSEYDIEPSRRCLNLSTMHGAKGKEWKHVILLGVDGYSCPAYDRVSSLTLTSTQESISDFVEQERRLFYVAVTRAKEELTIITDLHRMSPFLMETLGLEQKNDTLNTHIITWAQVDQTEEEIWNDIEAINQEIEIVGLPPKEKDVENTGEENVPTPEVDDNTFRDDNYEDDAEFNGNFSEIVADRDLNSVLVEDKDK